MSFTFNPFTGNFDEVSKATGTNLESSTSSIANIFAGLSSGTNFLFKGLESTDNSVIFSSNSTTINLMVNDIAVTNPLSTVLSFGNTTGGTDLLVSAGDELQLLDFTSGGGVIFLGSNSNLTANPSSFSWINSNAELLVTNINIPGTTTLNNIPYTWPSSAGASTSYLINDGSGSLTWTTFSSTAPTWSQVLSAGNSSGGTDVVLTNGDDFTLENGGSPTRIICNNLTNTNSRVRFRGGIAGFDFFAEPINGDIFHLQYQNGGVSAPDWIVDRFGVNERWGNIIFETVNFQIGNGFADNYTLTFGGNTNEGVIAYSGFTDVLDIETSGVQISQFTSAGFVKNNANGLLSGGNSIVLSSDSDITTSSPITFISSTIGFDFSHNFISSSEWTGEHVFNGGDLTWRGAGSSSLFLDQSTGRFLYTLPNDSGARGFSLEKTESVAPSGAPEYFNIDINRTWTGGQATSVLLDVTLNDDRTLNSGVTSLTKLFRFTYDMDGLTGHSNAEFPVGFEVDFTGAPSYQGSTFGLLFGLGGDGTNNQNWSPAYNTSNNRDAGVRHIGIYTIFSPQNAGSGTLTADYRGVDFGTAFGLIEPALGLGPDVYNIEGYWFHPTATFGATTGLTTTVYVNRIDPTFTTTGGTTTLYGMYYNPTLSGGGTNLSYIIWAESGNIVLDSDSIQIELGEGQDSFIQYDGTDLLIESDTGIQFTGNMGFYGTTPVAQSSAYTPTNVSTDRSYDANSTTVNELADVLGTLIADLQATGLIG